MHAPGGIDHDPPYLILLVEDEPNVRAVLAQALMDAGLAVAEAPGQTDAERLLSSDNGRHFALLVTDLGLHDGDGGALIDAASVRGIPSICITGYPDRVTAGVPVGLCALLAKPFRLDHLIEAVEQALPRPPEPA
jgi:DNA-binding NtrC family response regulator